VNLKNCLVFVALLIMTGASVVAQKTDKVLLDNNDWITGEIKKLDYGKLTLKTSAAGTISIKWDQIFQIKSDKYFEISLGRGNRYFGSLDVTENDEKYKLLIVMEEETVEVNMNRVVEITRINNRFWGKLDGNLDFGFSYTKGSEVRQLNSSMNLEYRPTNSLTTISGNSILTEQPERNTTTKQDLSVSYRYFTKNNFAYAAFASLQQNSELGLQLRSSVGVGLSKNWLRSNAQRLINTIGIIVNQEISASNTETNRNYEGLLRIDYRIFRYRDPEISLTTYFDFYPSFTVKDRFRTDLNLQLRFELFQDFYLGLTFYHNLDTKPLSSAISSSDWGVTTSIGYKF
jgi:hypothetical protein